MTTVNRSTDPRPRRFHRDIDGILLLDKAYGLSSNAALQQVRVLFGARKAGHAGSLDPLAEGMLPVCFGQATKVCGRLLDSGKTYRVKLSLGARTESGDRETAIIERAAIPSLNDSEVDAVLARFMGEQEQVPPMHSALKFEGKRLYEYARRGESVERAPRRIHIRRLQRVGRSDEHLEFEVDCSKGTYIRTLATEIAAALGTLGYVEVLRRMHVEPFGGLPMYTLNDLAARPISELDSLLLPTDAALPNLPSVQLDRANEEWLLQGRTVITPIPAMAGGQLRAYGPQGRFLGVVEGTADGRIKPSRLFVPASDPPA
jgi:tRNA pseudouridine55 synthase